MDFITGLSINTINQAILGRKVGRHQRGNQKTYIEGDNTMTKRKGTKGQTVVVKTLHRKLKIE